jgi:hypothetical protein
VKLSTLALTGFFLQVIVPSIDNNNLIKCSKLLRNVLSYILSCRIDFILRQILYIVI